MMYKVTHGDIIFITCVRIENILKYNLSSPYRYNYCYIRAVQFLLCKTQESFRRVVLIPGNQILGILQCGVYRGG